MFLHSVLKKTCTHYTYSLGASACHKSGETEELNHFFYRHGCREVGKRVQWTLQNHTQKVSQKNSIYVKVVPLKECKVTKMHKVTTLALFYAGCPEIHNSTLTVKVIAALKRGIDTHPLSSP